MCVQTPFGLLITLSLYRPIIVFKRLLDQNRNCVDLCHESMLGVVCLVFVLGIRCVQLVPMSSEPPCHHWNHNMSAHSCFCKRCLWLQPVQPVHVQLQPVHVWLLRRAIKPSKRLRSLGLQFYSVNSSRPKWMLTLRWYVNDFWSRFWWVFIGGISWKLQQDVRNILNSILLLIRKCFCYFCRCPMNAYTLAINRLHQSGYTDNDMYAAWWHNPDGSHRPSSLWAKISTQSAALLQGSNRNHVMEFHNDAWLLQR